MISRDFVRKSVMQRRMDLAAAQVDRLIDDAVRMLGNLVHYKNGGSHEDEDVITAVLVIGQDKQEEPL
jgi:hypothetical protein